MLPKCDTVYEVNNADLDITSITIAIRVILHKREMDVLFYLVYCTKLTCRIHLNTVIAFIPIYTIHRLCTFVQSFVGYVYGDIYV